MSIVTDSTENPSPDSAQPASHEVEGADMLAIHYNDGWHHIPFSNISEHGQQTAFCEQLDQHGAVTCDLRGVLHWAPATRKTVFTFVQRLIGTVTSVWFHAPDEDQPIDNLFQAMLATIQANEDPAIFQRAVDGAIQAAVICHGDALRPACSRIVKRIRQTGVTGFRIADIVSDAQQIARQMRSGQEDTNPDQLSAIWPDLEGCEGFVIPPNWLLSDSGIVRTDAEYPTVIPARIAITRRLQSATTAASWLEIAWSHGREWSKRTFPRSVVADRSKIVGLADQDIPVNSNNAADIIDFLADFEAANRDAIPEAIVSDQMGWVGEEGRYGFLAGRTLINGQIAESDLSGDGTQQVVFQGADDGDEQLADSLTRAGAFEEWRLLIEPLQRFSRVMLAVYASFVAPLLMILRSSNFVLSFAGPTSCGKTSTLCCAAATWGCPDNHGSGQYTMTWNATRVGLERSMCTLNDIPVIIDDTKLAHCDEDVAERVFDVAAGRSRARGSVHGLAPARGWRTTMITSGEQPINSFSKDGGTAARTIEIWNSPFGETSPAIAALVAELRNGFAENYGHAGPRFVAFLIANRSRWIEWRQFYEQRKTAYEQTAGANSVAARLGANGAAIEVAATLAHEALGLSFPYGNAVADLWPELTRDTIEADRAAEAMRMLINHCATNQHRFRGQACTTGGSALTPAGGYLGVWRYTTIVGEPHDVRAVFVAEASDVLRQGGFEPVSMRRLWKDRGWITANPGKTSLKIRFDAGTTEAVAIRVDVIAQLMATE